MTLSTIKAELVESSEVFKEVIFVRNILSFLIEPVNYPIFINIDNCEYTEEHLQPEKSVQFTNVISIGDLPFSTYDLPELVNSFVEHEY